MVILNRRMLLSFLVLLTASSTLVSIPRTKAQITYSVNREWVQIWINKDTSIDLQYNITLTYLSGDPEGIVTVGMPKGGFQISYVKDLSGTTLGHYDIAEGSFYGIEVTLNGPIVLNRPYSFLVYAVIPSMVYPDTTNEGNAGMAFYTTTFQSASAPIGDVRVLIVLPEGVTSSEVKHPTDRPFDSIVMEGDNIAVYWGELNWPAAEPFTVGVSFPENYISYPKLNIWFYLAVGLVIVTLAAVIIYIVRRGRRAFYEKPKIAIEALGAARGLTSVEAAIVLGLKPTRVLTMVLFGMLKKRFIIVEEIEPLIKIKVLDDVKNRTTPSSLRYYEIDFVKAVESDGTLDEERLARTYVSLRDNVDRKLRGYSRIDTINYYQSIVDKAWNQVTQASTPELKGDALESSLEWLLMDNKYDEKFRTAFPPNIIIVPRPTWWWYWYGPYFPRGSRTTSTGTPGGQIDATPIPAQEWSNNIVRGLETTTNNIVKNIQDFTNKITGAQTVPSSRSARQGSKCVCACANCACACACVGCACACAGGGAR